MTERVQLVGPLPPLPTGIARHTEEFIRAVGAVWNLALLPEPGSQPPSRSDVTLIDPRRGLSPDAPVIFQIGNSLNHPRATEHALQLPGVVVLHDVVLSHSRLGYHLRRRWPRGFVKEMRDSYGPEGRSAARRMLRDPTSPELMKYPLVERFIHRARLVVVHNRLALRMVRSLCPDAHVLQVPQGVAIPHPTDRQFARQLIGLPERDFVVLSLTHVNRFKRIPQVIAAFCELKRRVPNATLVIAGRVGPDIDLPSEIAMLNLENYVQLRGYVSDEEAGLLARACDVAVNLRYPSTGETSASLLRLLGSGLPVIVSEGTLGDQLPDGVGLRVPVGDVEVPLLAELLAALEAHPDLRARIGQRGREFIQEQHSMGAEIDGYSRAIELAYGIELPRAPSENLFEQPPRTRRTAEEVMPSRASHLDDAVGSALASLGLQRHSPLLRAAAERIVELNLDERGSQHIPPDP